ncbi:phosphate 1 [Actinidia rufa]|uniref:Phosphate 1 n=1 Tax=Actinidia rufa TaxID=165716 RepID=A0A7J0F354_9ERIC|nr:phosphate 1 [Actinidia rufa]
MVKFSKELEAQLIPEWKDAFVNYWQLKKHVKKIKLSIKSTKQTQDPNSDFGLSIFDPIRFVVNKLSDRLRNAGDKPEIIQVKSKVTEREDDEEEEEVYETELSQLFCEEDEVKVFFERLDEELNKVNQFYKTKESEFLGRGEILNKQLQTLLERKQILSDRHRKSLSGKSATGFFPPSYSSSARNSDYSESPTEYSETSEADDATASPTKTKKEKPKMGMRVDIPMTTPTRVISTVTSTLWEDIVLKKPKKEGQGDLINRKKTQCAEKMIRGAFVELYRGLGLLKTYSSLNMMAFTKILKKFDKVSNQQASASYLKVVKRSNFISSDKGGFVTLFSVYGILAHLFGMFSPTTEPAYMETVYPVFSMFALLSLHLFMYGCNLFMWKSTRINYNFIFEFQHSTALKYRDAFLICTSLMTAVVAAMVIHLLLLSNGVSPHQVDAIPGILLLVLMVDFFMADQLTSQIPLLRHMESTACYFIAGSFKTHRYEMCKSGKLYRELAYVISFAPYYWRAMQCARRWLDECDVNHLANLGKYVSAMVAAGARITYARQPTELWMVIVLVTSLVATVYQLYWDFVKDWGIFNPKSKNPWLRDDLILKNKNIYYVSIALNFVLRVAWVETVMRFNIGVFESRLLEFFLASLEIIRRGHWNFYRLENEHLNNVGKFRAVKAVPLPFRETDSDG